MIKKTTAIMTLAGVSAVFAPAGVFAATPYNQNQQYTQQGMQAGQQQPQQQKTQNSTNPTKPVAKKDLPPPPPDFAEQVAEQSLTPEEIRKLRKLVTEQKRAGSELAGTPPKPKVRTAIIDLSPGATPEVIRLSPSQGATLVFVDADGEPWPINAFTNFAPDFCEIKNPIDGGHILTIEPKDYFGNGNASIMLKDLPTPILLSVVGGQKEVDFRVDMQIPKHQKNAVVKNTEVPPVIDPIFQEVISGVVLSEEMKPIKASPSIAKFWMRKIGKTDAKLYIRTDGILISPAPTEGKKAVASDKSRAYEIPVTPVVTILRNGRPENITLDIE